MTALSTHILGPNGTLRQNVFAPFVVYARFQQTDQNPMSGNRWEKWRAEQLAAELIEIDLKNLVEDGYTAATDDDFELFISFPIAFTRQFGQEPSRITIQGNYRGSIVPISTSDDVGSFPPKKVAEDVTQINANEARVGQGAFNAANLTPLDVVNQFANQIKALFENTTLLPNIDRVEVMTVEVFNIKYGRGGRHFSPAV